MTDPCAHGPPNGGVALLVCVAPRFVFGRGPPVFLCLPFASSRPPAHRAILSGFVHSAFTFAHEGLLGRTSSAVRGDLPSGALVSFLHKGLQYMQIEAHLDEVPCAALPFYVCAVCLLWVCAGVGPPHSVACRRIGGIVWWFSL